MCCKIYPLLIFFGIVNSQAKIEIISLGNACRVAGALRHYKLRDCAYPFDWIVSPFDGLYKIFENDFEDFLKRDYLQLRADGRAIVNTLYGFEFVHDFTTVFPENVGEDDPSEGGEVQNFLISFEKVKQKYIRRIKRLQRVLSGNEKVVFIRNRDINWEQAAKFYYLLKKKFPALPFTLVVIDDESKLPPPSKETLEGYKIKFFGDDYI